MKKFLLFLFPAIILITTQYFAQNGSHALSEDPVRVFIDCHRCDYNYIRDEIKFVDFVRDRKFADVHVLFNSINAGGFGRQHTLSFYGLNKFEGVDDTLTYVQDVTDTDNSERKKMIKVLKLGLIQYVAKTSARDNLNIQYSPVKTEQTMSIDDPWNYWVFRTGFDSFLNGEESSNFADLEYSLTASRITEDWKFRISYEGNYNESNFKYDEENIKNITRSHRSYDYVIGALSDHWSAGAWMFLTSSTYENLDFKTSIAPGIEYNIFPYSEFNNRQIRIQFQIWTKYHNYKEETIYLKTEEFLVEPSLRAVFDFVQPWGSMSVSINMGTHLHDLKKNTLSLRSRVSLQIVKGLSLDISGGFSAIHDQLSLPRSNASLDEVLLQQRQLATDFQYWGSVGVSFTFGSIYYNFVNPRFGNH